MKAKGTASRSMSLLISWPLKDRCHLLCLQKSQFSTALGLPSVAAPWTQQQTTHRGKTVQKGVATREVVWLLWIKSKTQRPHLQLISGIKVSVSQVSNMLAAVETNPRRPDPGSPLAAACLRRCYYIPGSKEHAGIFKLVLSWIILPNWTREGNHRGLASKCKLCLQRKGGKSHCSWENSLMAVSTVSADTVQFKGSYSAFGCMSW